MFGLSLQKLALVTIAVWGTSCSHPEGVGSGVDISSSQSLRVRVGDSAETELPAGETLTVSAPALVSAPGFETMTVVPIIPGQAKLQLKLIPSNGPTAEGNQTRVDELIRSVMQVQELIAKRKSETPLAKIESMQSAWPKVYVLDYLKASALMMANDFEQARTVTEQALRRSPDDRSLQDLLKILKRER